MDHALSRLLTVSALGALSGVLAVTACTHTSDRVVEPVGGGDASTSTPALGDAEVSPLGPIAQPEPKEDFRLVRAPELGVARERTVSSLKGERADGLAGSGGSAGTGGSDLRPVVACGGANYY